MVVECARLPRSDRSQRALKARIQRVAADAACHWVEGGLSCVFDIGKARSGVVVVRVAEADDVAVVAAESDQLFRDDRGATVVAATKAPAAVA